MFFDDKNRIVILLIIFSSFAKFKCIPMKNNNGQTAAKFTQASSNDYFQEREIIQKKNDTIKYTVSLYLKYYELIQENIFPNSTYKKKVIINFNILKNKLIDFMNQSDKNKKVLYKILIDFLAKSMNKKVQ